MIFRAGIHPQDEGFRIGQSHMLGYGATELWTSELSYGTTPDGCRGGSRFVKGGFKSLIEGN